MTFRDARAFKEIIIRFSIQERRALKVIRNTSGQIRAKCVKKNCPFTLYASFDNATKCYQVKTFKPTHTCSVAYKNKRVTAKWLATNYLYKYKCIYAMKL